MGDGYGQLLSQFAPGPLHQAVTQIACGCPQGVEEHIIHIKAPYLEHQLQSLQHQTENKAEHNRVVPLFAASADYGEKEPKRHEGRHISYHVNHEQCGPQHVIMTEIPHDFLKGHQIILVPPAGVRAPETL